MGLDNTLTDGQPEPGTPGRRPIGAVKAFENTYPMFFDDSRALIHHVKDECGAFLLDLHHDPGSRFGVLGRILYQVGQHQGNTLSVGHHGGKTVARVYLQIVRLCLLSDAAKPPLHQVHRAMPALFGDVQSTASFDARHVQR